MVGPFGGTTAAAALAAVLAHPARQGEPIALTVNFAGPVAQGAFDVEAPSWGRIPPVNPRRVNVEFVELVSSNEVRQRTWERGSGETMACGTGASAVCVAGVLSGRTERKLTNHLQGGTLHLEWSEENNHVYMTGPAVEVFTGTYRLR